MAGSDFIGDPETLRALAPVAAAPITRHVFVCTGKSCSARDSAEVLSAFERELKARGILFGKEAKGKNPNGSVVLTECASVGFCAIGAAVMIYPDGVWYAQVRADDVPQIVEEHMMNGRVVERLALMKVPVSEPGATATGSAHVSEPGATATGSRTRGEDWDA
ncbi:MAG TPA: (2Fe-2S) ferredoxin domain-containing protein [Pyrinomonadaceae bacterium]|nr:(2Fe-2S) ferredoxin domain-containing protein [Pyrinomonadaceae bacterium]